MAGSDGERRLAALAAHAPHLAGGASDRPVRPEERPSPSVGTGEDLRRGAELRTQVALQAAARRTEIPVDAPRRRWALRPPLALLAGAVVLALAGVVVLRTVAPSRPMVVASLGEAAGSTVTDGTDAASEGPAEPAGLADGTGAEVVVHVVGEVVEPGVVRLPVGSRVVDAVTAAGGASAAAQLSALNLARVLDDGEQVVVPGPGAPLPAATGAPAAVGADDRLDLNSADAAALDALPGIGPVLAARIVAWRDEHGGFTTVDELAEVDGIGSAVLAAVRDLVHA